MAMKNLVIVLTGGVLILTSVLGFLINFLHVSGICYSVPGIIGLAMVWVGIHNEQHIKSKSDVQTQIRNLEHKDPTIKSEAARNLGALKDSRAIAPLITMLQDGNFSVQNAAAEALRQIDGLDMQQRQILLDWGLKKNKQPSKSPPVIPNSIKMDNAVFTVMGNGNIVIRKQTVFAWILAALVGSFLIFMSLVLLNEVLRTGKANMDGMDWIEFILLGLWFLSLAESAWNVPSVFIDKATNIMEIKHGLSSVRIPFSELVEVKTALPLGFLHVIGIGIVAVLENKKTLRLGSVSILTGGKEIVTQAANIMVHIDIATGIINRPKRP